MYVKMKGHPPILLETIDGDDTRSEKIAEEIHKVEKFANLVFLMGILKDKYTELTKKETGSESI